MPKIKSRALKTDSINIVAVDDDKTVETGYSNSSVQTEITSAQEGLVLGVEVPAIKVAQ